ncbi:hypothetical protein [Succinatimonas hippei]|nr:hypothetical protein [Succinatimonas hippei]
MGGKCIAKEIKQKALELFQQGFSYKATGSQLSLKQSKEFKQQRKRLEGN